MVIVRIIARLNIGGPARHCAVLARGLAAEGHRTILVHGTVDEREGSMAEAIEPGTATLVLVPELGRRIRPWSDVVALLRIWRLLRTYRPDVVHTHTAKAGAVGRIAAALLDLSVPRHRRTLIVHTYHGHVLEGYFGRAGNALVRSAERALARITDRIVAISQGQRHDLVDRFHVAQPSQVRVVPLGLDLEPLLARPLPSGLREELGIDPAALVVVFVGRLVPVKAPGVLLEAFERVTSAHPDAHLLVVGDGPLREAVQAAAAALPGRVHLLGWRDDLARVYDAADVVALASHNEGTPVALIEAMAAGRAVVATAVGGVPDVVEHGVSGLLVPPRDPAALAEALLSVGRDAGFRGRLGATGSERVAARFGAARLVREIAELYDEGLEEARGSRGAPRRRAAIS